MRKMLVIKNRPLEEILNEGTHLIESGILTGFNFNEPIFGRQVALCIEYYHNIDQHIKEFLYMASLELNKKVGYTPLFHTEKKWGIFKWIPDFEPMTGNKYYAIRGNFPHYQWEVLEPTELRARLGSGLILAKDKSFVVSCIFDYGDDARHMLDFIKEKCRRYLSDGNLNRSKLGESAHAKPFYMLTDDNDSVVDKSDLKAAQLLRLRKGNRLISSLVDELSVPPLMQRLAVIPCGLAIEKERRYVDIDFFKDY